MLVVCTSCMYKLYVLVVCTGCMYWLCGLVLCTNNRIWIPYNCVELIFGMVHPSTFKHIKTQLVFDSWSILCQTLGSSSVTDG